MLVEKEVRVKSYADIAFLLDKSSAEVASFINAWLPGKGIISHQMLLDENKKRRPPVVRKPREKKKKDPIITSRIIQADQKQKRTRNGLPIFKTKAVDLSQLVQVKINRKTWIYIKPGEDPEEARAKFLQRLSDYNSRTNDN